MLKRKHMKKLVCAILSLGMFSIFLSNQAIHTALFADVDQDFTRLRAFKDNAGNVRTNDTFFHFEGYGYPYPVGCEISNVNSLWKEIVPGSVYISSSFYDDRNQMTHIRMIAAILKESQHNLWCHFMGSNGFISVKVSFHEMSENHNLPFGGWTLSCEVPEVTSSSCEITLSTSQSYSTTNSTMYNLTVFAVNLKDFGLTKKKLQFAFLLCLVISLSVNSLNSLK